MARPTLEGRNFFRSSGRVNWVRFLPWSALAFVAAVSLAGLLFFLFSIGFYLLVVVPAVAGLGVSAMVILAVKKGHCRSRLIGALLGILAGFILYFGYYYIGMVHDLGLEYAGEFNVLPKYIQFRMKTNTVREVGAPTPDASENKPRSDRQYFNWGWFVFEFGSILFLACGGGLRWSARPYCERCQNWMKRESTTFKPELGPGFVEALRIGSVQSLAALFTSPQKPGIPHTAVAVDYCPNLKEGRSSTCSVYMSIKQVTTKAKGVTTNSFEQSKGKMLLRQILVSPDEVPALLTRFTSLEKIAGTTAAQALQELRVEIKSNSSTKVAAEVKPVDPAYAGKVLTTKTGLICTAYSLLGIVGVFGPIGLGFLGGYLAFPDHPPAAGVSAMAKLSGEFLIGLAILIFIANFVMLFLFPDFFATRYLYNLALREFKRRTHPLVNPADPTALFVQIIPRANWAKMKLIDASDIGFLRVDPQRNELLFEGDKEFYRIPATAITSCDIEIFISGEGTHGATKLYRVVLQANHPSGIFWEAPFAQRGNSGKFKAKTREKWARELQQKICGLMSPTA